jgi:hypothetical protein
MNREKKTSRALAAIVMEEIRLHPGLNEIRGVTIRHTERHNPKAPNWGAAFELIGYDANGYPMAYEILCKLQSRFDLV